MITFLGRHSEPEDHIQVLFDAGYDVRIVPAGDTKKQVLDNFAKALNLPPWFGHNWDALVDALRDLDGRDGEPVALVWDHARDLRAHDRTVYDTVVDILEEVADERPELRVTVITR